MQQGEATAGGPYFLSAALPSALPSALVPAAYLGESNQLDIMQSDDTCAPVHIAVFLFISSN